MRFGQERIDLVPLTVERQRMRTCFGWHDLGAAHRVDIDDVYDPWIADGDIKASSLRMQENNVGAAAQGHAAERSARSRVDGEQHAGIAGAEQVASGRIQIKP